MGLRRNERGAVLATVVILGAVIGILALATYRFVEINTTQTGHLRLRREAQYSSYAAVEATLFGLRNKTSDDLAGIVAPDGTPAGFDAGALYLNVDNATWGTEKTNTLGRKNVQVTVAEEGTTNDGLRKRYKITTETTYTK